MESTPDHVPVWAAQRSFKKVGLGTGLNAQVARAPVLKGAPPFPRPVEHWLRRLFVQKGGGSFFRFFLLGPLSGVTAALLLNVGGGWLLIVLTMPYTCRQFEICGVLLFVAFNALGIFWMIRFPLPTLTNTRSG